MLVFYNIGRVAVRPAPGCPASPWPGLPPGQPSLLTCPPTPIEQSKCILSSFSSPPSLSSLGHHHLTPATSPSLPTGTGYGLWRARASSLSIRFSLCSPVHRAFFLPFPLPFAGRSPPTTLTGSVRPVVAPRDRVEEEGATGLRVRTWYTTVTDDRRSMFCRLKKLRAWRGIAGTGIGIERCWILEFSLSLRYWSGCDHWIRLDPLDIGFSGIRLEGLERW